MSANHEGILHQRAVSLCRRVREHLPEVVAKPPPNIRDFGEIPFFFPCRYRRREPPSLDGGEVNLPVLCQVRTSIARSSIGTRSNEPRLSDYQWLLNKRLTCVVLWFGVICLIIGVIALQIASFFRHKKQVRKVKMRADKARWWEVWTCLAGSLYTDQFCHLTVSPTPGQLSREEYPFTDTPVLIVTGVGVYFVTAIQMAHRIVQ